MSQTARQIPETRPPESLRDSADARRERRQHALEGAQRNFLRMVSHELRTPLNAIIGFSEIIAAELYGPLGAPQYREYAEHVRLSGHRLLLLVNQVLEIAKLQGHAADLDMRVEPLDHALDDVCDQLRDELETHRTTIRIENDGHLPSVLADAKGLRTLLFNLLQNAILYGPPEGVVTIGAKQRGERVDIEIHDQGAGVDPADIGRLMNPFEQGENALTRTGQGAGLGLPIARLLAEAMDGQLRMTSPPGEGARVCVTLPAA